jgi:hypothetical protein
MVDYGSGYRQQSLPDELEAKQREIDKLLEDIKDFRGGIALEHAVQKELEAMNEEEESQGALEVIALEDTVLKMMLEDLVKAMKAKRQLQEEMEQRERGRCRSEPPLPPGFQ